jgi:UDP:flavonoid glycosyltransferase YjiC (YdhE family)
VQDGLFPVLGGPLLRERRRRGLGTVSSLYSYLAPAGRILAAVDTTLTPVPADAGSVYATGLWRRPAAGTLPFELDEFLRSGPTPLYVGFGSVRSAEPEKVARLAVAAAARAGVRTLYPAAPGVRASAPTCCAVENVPHDLLFPRVQAAIHHGGAGTFASAALAGRPQAVVAHLGDQYYHGFRVEALGVGPAPVSAGRLSVAVLARLMTDLSTNPVYERNADVLARQLRHDGADVAAELIENSATAE